MTDDEPIEDMELRAAVIHLYAIAKGYVENELERVKYDRAGLRNSAVVAMFDATVKRQQAQLDKVNALWAKVSKDFDELDEEEWGAPVTVQYRNHRGVLASRHIQPEYIWYGTTEWHTEPQWFLHATDLDKKEERDFALADMKWDAKPLCSFCQKSHGAVGRLLIGPNGVNICDACARVSVEVLEGK